MKRKTFSLFVTTNDKSEFITDFCDYWLDGMHPPRILAKRCFIKDE